MKQLNKVGAECFEPLLTLGGSGSTSAGVQPSLNDVLKARSVIIDVREDLVAAFTATRIPLRKIEHASIQRFLHKHCHDSSCFTKDDIWLQVFSAFSNCCTYIENLFH